MRNWSSKESGQWISPGDPVAKTCIPNAGAQMWSPDQELDLMPQLKILHATEDQRAHVPQNEDLNSQINKFF